MNASSSFWFSKSSIGISFSKDLLKYCSTRTSRSILFENCIPCSHSTMSSLVITGNRETASLGVEVLKGRIQARKWCPQPFNLHQVKLIFYHLADFSIIAVIHYA